MKRRYGVLALAIVSLLLIYLIWQDEPAAASNASNASNASQASASASASPQQATTVTSKQTQAAPPPSAVAANPTTAGAPPRSWRPLPQEAEEQLAGEIQESDEPLDERLEHLRTVEGQWPSEGESLTLLQGRYAQALAQLARDGEQLTLTERLAALTQLQDKWAAQYPDLAADLFNPDARLLQARQLWGDEELEILTRHFLPSERADASLAFAGQRQQQLDQRARYQQQLAELEQQLAASQGNMDSARWQQHREEVLGQWRRDFFAQEQAQR